MANQSGTIFFPHAVSGHSSPSVDVSHSNKGTADSRIEKIQKIHTLVAQTNKILFKSSTVFPFTMIPKEIIIDEIKVSILNRTFLGSGKVQSITISDILDVQIETSLIFSLIRILTRNSPDNPIEIPYMWRKDAMKARRIIQGLLILSKKNIDYSDIRVSDLLKMVEVLGKTNGTM